MLNNKHKQLFLKINMKLTIIPADAAVYKNNHCYTNLNLVNIPSNIHALQWNNTSGWVEFTDGSQTKAINELPDWAIMSVAVWDETDFNAKNPQMPTTEQLVANCKAKAKALLSQTDWSVLPDVGLANQDAFVLYRLNLRNLVINPVADAVFEAMPEPIWS